MEANIEETVDVASDTIEEQQPTRTGRHREARRFDKTQCRSKQYGYNVHRDYIAHTHRWGWVGRHVERGDRVLEVGCGQDLPLMHVLSGNMSLVPEYYVGFDLNKLEVPQTGVPKWATIIPEYNFVDNGDKEKLEKFLQGKQHQASTRGFNVAVCFEVIEHMGLKDGASLLANLFEALESGGHMYLSTPVFNGRAAVNHVHEYEIPELQSAIETAGFEVVRRHGTFASKNDLKRVWSDEHKAIYEALESYYGGDMMSTFLAPLYPDASRNNMWVCRKP